MLKKPDQQNCLVTCLSDQTPNSEFINHEFILRNLFNLLKTYFCYLENEYRPKKYKRLSTISNSLKRKIINIRETNQGS